MMEPTSLSTSGVLFVLGAPAPPGWIILSSAATDATERQVSRSKRRRMTAKLESIVGKLH